MDDICTLRTVLERNLEYNAGKIALVEGNRQYSFLEFTQRTRAMGNALLNLGLKKGDRVAILSHNSIENAESYFSIPNVGLVLVMLNFRLAPMEILGSCGRSFADMQSMVVDDDDQPVSPGEVGEMKVRGLGTTLGYWNKPEETRKDFRNGAYYSQDLCRVDEQGFIYVVDRKKDMIITGGENVYPAEVENVLYKHPGVSMAAVIGTPDDKWGEAVTALIVKKDDASFDIDDIKAFVRGEIAGYKVPKKVLFVESLPMSASGKILKYKLRTEFSA